MEITRIGRDRECCNAERFTARVMGAKPSNLSDGQAIESGLQHNRASNYFFFFFFRADSQLLNVNKPTTTTTSLSSVYISLSLYLAHKILHCLRIIFLRKMKRLVSSAVPRLSESGGQEFAETKKPGNWKARTTVRE